MCCTFLTKKTWLIHLSQNQSILEMIQTPVIVTFANQKGGVGKTTLCVTFANYLVTKGVRVVVIDCDFQHSIMKCRKADIRKYGEQEMPYEVWAYEANDKVMMTSLMEKLHNDPEIDVVLMDISVTTYSLISFFRFSSLLSAKVTTLSIRRLMSLDESKRSFMVFIS